jgi:8-oxo-dGTP diphosphatase
MGFFDPGPHVRVGVGLMIVKESQVLCGKRKGAHGEGAYGWPGGGVEYGETILHAAYRELAEECGPDIKITKPRLLCLTDFATYEPQHWLDVGMICEYVSGEPVVMEPHKCTAWEWHDIDNLPTPLFEVVDAYIQAYKNGIDYHSMGDLLNVH